LPLICHSTHEKEYSHYALSASRNDNRILPNRSCTSTPADPSGRPRTAAIPPDSPYIKKERINEPEQYNMMKGVPGRISSGWFIPVRRRLRAMPIPRFPQMHRRRLLRAQAPMINSTRIGPISISGRF